MTHPEPPPTTVCRWCGAIIPTSGSEAWDDRPQCRDRAACDRRVEAELRERQRRQLLEAMSAVSEVRYATAWEEGLGRRLHDEGGIWAVLGRAAGWPVGEYRAWVWVSWEDARRRYARAARRRAARATEPTA